MNGPVSVGRHNWLTEFSVGPLSAVNATALQADSSLTISNGSTRMQTYVTATELRALAHMLTLEADRLEIARQPQEAES